MWKESAFLHPPSLRLHLSGQPELGRLLPPPLSQRAHHSVKFACMETGRRLGRCRFTSLIITKPLHPLHKLQRALHGVGPTQRPAIKLFLHGYNKTVAVGQRTWSSGVIAGRQRVIGRRRWKRASDVLSRWWILWGVLHWERTSKDNWPPHSALLAVGNSGAKVERERKGGNS